MDASALIVMDLLAKGAVTRDQARTLLASDGAPGTPAAPAADEPVAVVGVAANLPHAEDYDDFWDVLTAGTDCNEPLPQDRRDLCDVLGEDPQRTFLAGSWISGIELFDHEFFGITPAEAISMDPQQRRFLEVAYHCLEDAGWAGRVRGTRTGVYGSFDGGDYRLGRAVTSPVDIPGRLGSFAASRLSYWLDLSGPASVTSCTCASAAMALHQACLGLRAGDCDMALVGGANLLCFPVERPSLLADASGIMSADSTCRPFDDGARGVGRGEGVVALMLKPLSAARRDGDRVRATIHATAVNNDGRSAMLTAPNPTAQTALLTDAWAKAGWAPSSVDYIEAHGTGTELGDPIEIKAITDAAARHSVPSQTIALGSVKGNIGHLLDGAAGLAGLVKALLVLEHHEVPPTVNLLEPSRHIDFLDSPVFLPTGGWPLDEPRDRPLRAGVSCFGFNGTNVHTLLQAPETHGTPEPGPAPAGPVLVPLSARTPEALADLVGLLARRGVGGRAEGRLVDLAWTLGVGREHHAHRVGLLATDLDGLADLCRTLVDTPPGSWHTVPGVLTAHGGPDGDDPALRSAAEWVAGGRYDADALATSRPRVVPAPTYPFRRTRVWPEPPPAGTPAAAAGGPLAAGPVAQAGAEPTGADPLKTCLVVVREALGMPDVGPEDSFLALGGSSLAALKIQADLRSRLGVEVTGADILAADSIRDLGTIVAEQKGNR